MEFWFDFSCPYAFLASRRVRELVPESAIDLRPVLLGGIFNALGGQPMDAFSPAKARHNLLDMHRWAQRWDEDFAMPATHPMRTVKALRMLLAAPRASWWSLIDAIYAAYWVEGRDVTSIEVLLGIAEGVGLDRSALAHGMTQQEVKDELRTRTDAAVKRGLFGVPAFSLGDDSPLWWGQDRLEHAAVAAGHLAAIDETPWSASQIAAGKRVDVWFDFSSPFAYLGCAQVEAVCARYGAEVVWQPFLLGGLFRAIGTPDVPLFAASPAKAEYFRQEMARFAALREVPFAFPSRFPMRTILPLRAVIAAQRSAPDHVGALIQRIFRAYWGEDQDIADGQVVAACANEVGLDGEAIVAETSNPEVKAALIAQLEAAKAAGAFGAPTFVVDGGEPLWGQDRLGLLAAVLNGAVDDATLVDALG